ncbi:hypothetical protein SAMN05216266_11448 [Amycolatopsis marina]|uniref:Uncharacterized protein n=1 Tax=Amycolatopsis marina TaxID=490629 RepID=A0A1I1BGM0_9PSEU|nr:hypothetical protein [Amycolatopsis marina]SFB49504.1 hypothetical protein SAMN05216266_11448 [Amycolatopsis marina]
MVEETELADPDGPVVDAALARRLKALACTAPVHDLDARKGRLDWAEADVYQMSEIALTIIDQVTIRMDFDRGADHEEVLRRTLPFVAAQAPDRPRDEHRKIARWVLDNLINVGTQDRGFSATYGTFDAEGRYERRTWPFKLLVESFSADGEVYLRSTDEAINVLVGALDTDVESAQEAAETKLANLVRRGRLSDAQLAAEAARWRTVQYADQLRRLLDATRRDVRAVDWLDEVPSLIKEALDHIAARHRAETAILTNITQARDESESPARKRQAATLITIVRDCMQRHGQLQARLILAGKTFRSEQDRQEFSEPARRASIDLFGQLLTPTLGLSIAEATGVTTAFFAKSTGLSVKGVPRLVDVVYKLLAPPADRVDLGDPVPEPDLVPAADPAVFDDEQWTAADRLLALGSVPRRLSGLLAEARALDPDLPHLIGLRVLHLLDPGVTTALRQGDESILLATDDGTELADDEFGGADLLVGLVSLEIGRHSADRVASGENRGEVVA